MVVGWRKDTSLTKYLFSPKNMAAKKQNKIKQKNKNENLTSICPSTYCFLLLIIPLERNAALSFFLLLAMGGTEGRTSAKFKGDHLLLFLFPPTLF